MWLFMSGRIQNTFSGQVEDELKFQIELSLIDSQWLQEGSPDDELRAQELLARIDGFRKIIASHLKASTFSQDLETIQNRCTFQKGPPATPDIEVRCAVAFGHTLFIRGSGCGLNWNKGIPLTEKAEGLLVYRPGQPLKSGTEYKFLYD